MLKITVQNQGHKHVIVNLLFQKIIYGNIVNKVLMETW